MRKLTIYAFPAFLLLVEHIFRTISGIDTMKFMGPTLASSGLSFLITLLNPKQPTVQLSQTFKDEMRDKKLKVVLKKDDNLTGLAIFFIFVLIAAWIITLYLSSKTSVTIWWFIPDYLAVGLFSYFIGVSISAIREVAK